MGRCGLHCSQTKTLQRGPRHTLTQRKREQQKEGGEQGRERQWGGGEGGKGNEGRESGAREERTDGGRDGGREAGRDAGRKGGREGQGEREGRAAWETVCMAAPILAGMQVRRTLEQVWVFLFCFVFFSAFGIQLIGYFNFSISSRGLAPTLSFFTF